MANNSFGQKHELPYDPKLNDMMDTLFTGYMRYTTTAAAYTALMSDTLIEITADKVITVPDAAASNKGKFFRLYYSAVATTGDVVDVTGTTIIDKTLLLDESIHDLVSTGTAWKHIPICLGA